MFDHIVGLVLITASLTAWATWALMQPKGQTVTQVIAEGIEQLCRTELPGGAWVSTVSLGRGVRACRCAAERMVHRPECWLRFETMVFAAPDSYGSVDCKTYSTREEAEAGHDEMVTTWTGWTPGDPEPTTTPDRWLCQDWL